MTRATLYTWLELEKIKESLCSAVEDSLYDDFLSHLYHYLSTATNDEKDWSELPWIKVRDLFVEIEEENAPTKLFPILLIRDKKEESGWEYEGRTWYFWLNLFSYYYGWTIEYVKELDIDDAIGLLQEILMEEQRKKDFIWTTTEIGYDYNKNTKKSSLNPLDRPEWMKQQFILEDEPKEKKTKIRRDFLPIGKIVSWDEKND